MAAPVATVRVAPTGIKLPDGYQALITFKEVPNVNFFEKTVQPPGADGGEPIEQSTMFNADFRTYAPRQLITLTPHTCKVAYDPNVLSTIINTLINFATTVTVVFFDGSTWAFFGYLQKFIPDPLEEGKQPEAMITVVPTNFDPVNHVEAGPTVVAVAGT